MKGDATPAEVYDSVKKMVDELLFRARQDSKSMPVVLVVNVEIKQGHLEEFLKVINYDAEGSRRETDCYRFDVLRDMENDHKFIFYEAYKDASSIDVHKATPHYAAWTKFKESGGVVSASAVKMNGYNFTF